MSWVPQPDTAATYCCFAKGRRRKENMSCFCVYLTWTHDVNHLSDSAFRALSALCSRWDRIGRNISYTLYTILGENEIERKTEKRPQFFLPIFSRVLSSRESPLLIASCMAITYLKEVRGCWNSNNPTKALQIMR